MLNIYSPEELAELWKVSTMTIYKLLGENKIPHFRVGRSYRIPTQYLEHYMFREGNLERFAPHPSSLLPNAVRYFLELLNKEPKKKQNNVIEILLYGSYARGSAGIDSDIDLLMVVKKLDSQVEEWVANLSDRAMASVDYGEFLSILRMSEKHWKKQEKLKTPLFEEIRKDGIVLWPNRKSSKLI